MHKYISKIIMILISIFICFMFFFILKNIIKIFKIYNTSYKQNLIVIFLTIIKLILIYYYFKYQLLTLSIGIVYNTYLLIQILRIKSNYNTLYNTIKDMDLTYKDDLIYIKKLV